MILLALGRADRAESICEEVLRARVKSLGEELAYTLWIKNDMAKAMIENGQPKAALQVLQRVEKVAIRTLGVAHSGTSMTRANEARAFLKLGMWQDAEEVILSLLKVVDSSHRDWGLALKMYVFALRQQGKETCQVCRMVAEARCND